LDYVRKNYKNLDIDFSIENEPLGTGGAVKLAIDNFKIKDNFILLNGDSIYLTNLEKLTNFHLENKSDLTLSLKNIKNPDRYGTVELDLDQRITNFKEKKSIAQGLINCGVYAINPIIFDPLNKEEKFSFEKDVMESFVKTSKYYGFVDNSYFIDIGLPESYDKAQNELSFEFSKIPSK
jgi:D-glycero-alpha-D-manno-heptose 1-phosphate guanylyltransferase